MFMKATIVQKSTFIEFCTIVAVQTYLSFYVHNICILISVSAAVLILHQEQIVLVHTVPKHDMVIAVCFLDMVTAVRICLAAGASFHKTEPLIYSTRKPMLRTPSFPLHHYQMN